MDNITHSLVGVVLADLSMLPGTQKMERRIFAGAGLIAANLPDIDLLYSGITPAPLGYLLHHRGHTHTVLGLGVLLAALVMAYRLVPPLRKAPLRHPIRLWMLIGIALASHILLDALNSYGVHPFYPVDSRWFYGDAVFIFEPWLWVVLGIAAGWSARRRIAKIAAALPVVILPAAIAFMGLIPVEAVAALAIVGALLAWLTAPMQARVRAGVALTLCVLIIGGLIAISLVARTLAAEALRPAGRGRLVDVILTPNPASPLCLAVIGIELDESGGEYILWRGTLSLVPQWKAPTSCASQRFLGSPNARVMAGGQFALTDEIHQPLQRLRDLVRTDCWARAWLQFGRAPVVVDGFIFDLRFGNRVGENFSYMPLKPQPEASRCPPNVTRWSMPRADLLTR